MLHILMSSPFKCDLILLLDMLLPSDDFLAIQDGVIISLNSNIFLKKIVDSCACLYVLEEDVKARGIYNNISTNFIPIDYDCFVSLTVKNKQQITW